MPQNNAEDPPPAEAAGVDPAAAPAATKRRSFFQRSASTVCLWAVLFLAFWISRDWLYFLIFSVSALFALEEYFRLFPDRGFRRFRWLAHGVAAGYLCLLFAPRFGFEAAWLSQLDGLALALLTTLVVLTRLRAPLEGLRTLGEIAVGIFGFVYCILLFGYVAKILMLPIEDAGGNPSAPYYLIYLVAVTKFTDLGAYAVGSLVGRDKMIPHVSPGKTWQGFAGALAVAVLTSFACTFLFGENIPLITPVHAAVLAVVIALVAVLGDLAESLFKRSLSVKDSGHVMPGIGGLLDLVDSVIFTAPVFYLYLRIFG